MLSYRLPSNLNDLSYNRVCEICGDLDIRTNWLTFGGYYRNKTKDSLIREIQQKSQQLERTRIDNLEQENRSLLKMNVRKNYAIQRLQKDLKELNSCHLETVCAQPLRENIFEWHINLLAPPESKYFPGCFHIVLKFSEEYPLKPPKAKMITKITHSHVYSSSNSKYWICLDLLETHHSNERYHGWSSCYTVLSIILQLQSFLLEEEDKVSKRMIKNDVDQSFRIKCKCGHNPSENVMFPIQPYWGEIKSRKDIVKMMVCSKETSIPTNPLLKKNKRNNNNNKKKEEDQIMKNGMKGFLVFPKELWIHIFSYYGQKELLKFSRVNSYFRKCSLHPYLWKKFDLNCFHSKLSFRESPLGIGITVDRNPSNGKIMKVSSPLDFICARSFFDEGIRKGIWKEPFDYFMPLFFDKSHWKSSEQYFENLICMIYEEEEFNPIFAVDLLCKLMSSMVVIIMKGELHGSLKAVQFYSFFHRILIYYSSKEYTSKNTNLVQTEINFRIKKFIEDERYRHKTKVPSLGDFITLVSVSEEYNWDDIRETYLGETLDRNSLWIRLKFGEREVLEENRYKRNMEYKLQKSFECVQVSKCFSIFHIFFLKLMKEVPTSMNQAQDRNILDILARNYDSRFGMIQESAKQRLQNIIFKVQNELTSYEQFHKILHSLDNNNNNNNNDEEEEEEEEEENTYTDEKMMECLQDSMKRARFRGYFERIDTSGSFLKGKIGKMLRERKMKKMNPFGSAKWVEKKKMDKKKKNEEIGVIVTLNPVRGWNITNSNTQKKKKKKKKRKKSKKKKKKIENKKKLDDEKFYKIHNNSSKPQESEEKVVKLEEEEEEDSFENNNNSRIEEEEVEEEEEEEGEDENEIINKEPKLEISSTTNDKLCDEQEINDVSPKKNMRMKQNPNPNSSTSKSQEKKSGWGGYYSKFIKVEKSVIFQEPVVYSMNSSSSEKVFQRKRKKSKIENNNKFSNDDWAFWGSRRSNLSSSSTSMNSGRKNKNNKFGYGKRKKGKRKNGRRF